MVTSLELLIVVDRRRFTSWHARRRRRGRSQQQSWNNKVTDFMRRRNMEWVMAEDLWRFVMNRPVLTVLVDWLVWCLLAGSNLWTRIPLKCSITVVFTCPLLSWCKISSHFRENNNVVIPVCLTSRSKVSGFKTGWGQWIFSGCKNPEHKS